MGKLLPMVKSTSKISRIPIIGLKNELHVIESVFEEDSVAYSSLKVSEHSMNSIKQNQGED